METDDDPSSLSPEECQALDEFVAECRETFGPDLHSIWLFGSAARHDRWRSQQQMRSDIDVLVVILRDVAQVDLQRLVDATYPLFLLCGAQISPQVRTLQWMISPPRDADMRFLQELRSDATGLFPQTIAASRFSVTFGGADDD